MLYEFAKTKTKLHGKVLVWTIWCHVCPKVWNSECAVCHTPASLSPSGHFPLLHQDITAALRCCGIWGCPSVCWSSCGELSRCWKHSIFSSSQASSRTALQLSSLPSKSRSAATGKRKIISLIESEMWSDLSSLVWITYVPEKWSPILCYCCWKLYERNESLEFRTHIMNLTPVVL